MYQYEVELKYVGKGKRPKYISTAHGFGSNPPIVLTAKTRKNALNQLKLPKTVQIRKVTRIPTGFRVKKRGKR